VSQGYFIAFEGGEGSGKTTQIHNLESLLLKEGFKVVKSFEPGGTVLGQDIRNLLIKKTSDPMCGRAEALLYAASRAEHVEKYIRPMLLEGYVVLCDRYIDASLAYQGVGRQLGFKDVLDLNLWATNNLLADRVYFFDFPAEKGLERARQRRDLDRLEAEPLNFHHQVQRAYQELAKKNPDRYLVVDASQTPEQLCETLGKDLLKWLQTRKKI
jgi:dTMP kinase